MVQTAPPETIERAHEEAFSKLTPQQRAQALRELTRVTPEEERPADGHSDDPRSLARLATRAELRQPGTMQRTLGGGGTASGGGMGMGSTIFTGLAAGFVGSMIAQQFFDSAASDFDAGGAGDAAGGSLDSGSAGEDFGGGDFGSDFGGDF